MRARLLPPACLAQLPSSSQTCPACLFPTCPCRGWEYFAFIDEWSTEFNFDGLAVWDTQSAYHHYPGTCLLYRGHV